MKKIFSVLLVFLMIVGISGCGNANKKKLVVFNWGEYIDQNVITEFEKKYNCDIVYETYDSNEMMYTKLQSGNNYDVLVPSDYMIERLIKENLVQKLDKSIVKNLTKVSADSKNLPYDPGNSYSAPYFLGVVGILYDKTQVKESDLKTKGWEILRDTAYKDKIYMYDSQRDSFMVALKALGYSMNTTDKNQINQAYNWLIDQQKKVNPIYAGDEMIDNMTNSMKALAVIYAGDAAAVIKENSNMDFYIPQEGTNTFSDGFVISKKSKQAKLANQFINFMLSDKIAYQNTKKVGYYPANSYAAKKAAAGMYKNNNAFVVRRGSKDEVFAYQDKETLTIYNNLWTKVKAK